MKKKAPFKAAVKKIGFFNKETDTIEIHEPARDYREKEALLFPDRIKDNTKKWEYQGHTSGYISKMPGREIDVYDDDKVKFFQTPSRTIGATQVIKNNETVDVKWTATKFKMEDFDKHVPLIDNTHTPRSRERDISLERNYEKKKKWIPNSFSLNEFKTKQKKSFVK